jgi:hypothetical protein
MAEAGGRASDAYGGRLDDDTDRAALMDPAYGGRDDETCGLRSTPPLLLEEEGRADDPPPRCDPAGGATPTLLDISALTASSNFGSE